MENIGIWGPIAAGIPTLLWFFRKRKTTKVHVEIGDSKLKLEIEDKQEQPDVKSR